MFWLLMSFINAHCNHRCHHHHHHHCDSKNLHSNLYTGMLTSAEITNSKRTEIIVTDTRDQLFLSDRKKQKSRNLNAYLVIGNDFIINKLLLAPEVFLGQGKSENILIQKVRDPALNTDKNFVGIFRRNLSYGAILKLGTTIKTYNMYVLTGIDRSRYHYQIDLTEDPGGAGTFDKKDIAYNKWKNGSIIGAGFEKKINCIKVGLEGRLISPKRFRYQNDYLGTPPDFESITATIKPKFSSALLRMSYLF